MTNNTEKHFLLFFHLLFSRGLSTNSSPKNPGFIPSHYIVQTPLTFLKHCQKFSTFMNSIIISQKMEYYIIRSIIPTREWRLSFYFFIWNMKIFFNYFLKFDICFCMGCNLVPRARLIFDVISAITEKLRPPAY